MRKNFVINFIRKRSRFLSDKNFINNPQILIIPGFTDKNEFVDQYFRILWYLNPILINGGQVWVPSSLKQNKHVQPPEYMDQSISSLETKALKHIHFFHDEYLVQWRKIIRGTNLLICWNNNLTGGINKLGKLTTFALSFKKRWNVDRLSNRHEGSFYLKISHDLNRHRDEDLKKSKEKLKIALAKIGNQRKAYVFGTGPSLEKAFGMSFNDGISIVCNSIVKNEKLMNHIKPIVIVFGDPIFHAGCSAYAGQFRLDLYSALEKFQCFVFVPFRDYALYMANIPDKFKSQIVGVPLEHLKTPNLNIKSSFKVMSTSNIITLLSIPISCSISKEINILGCDGRQIEDNKYFWNHHKDSQINEHMETIKQCHPAFFDIDYDDYYFTHCDIFETMLSHGESLGHSFHNLTKSYIPALKIRSH